MILIFILNRCNVNSINNIANDIDAIIINTIESDNISGKKVIENPKQNIPDIPHNIKKATEQIQKAYIVMVNKNCKNANKQNINMECITENIVFVPFFTLPPTSNVFCFSAFDFRIVFILSLAF